MKRYRISAPDLVYLTVSESEFFGVTESALARFTYEHRCSFVRIIAGKGYTSGSLPPTLLPNRQPLAVARGAFGAIPAPGLSSLTPLSAGQSLRMLHAPSNQHASCIQHACKDVVVSLERLCPIITLCSDLRKKDRLPRFRVLIIEKGYDPPSNAVILLNRMVREHDGTRAGNG